MEKHGVGNMARKKFLVIVEYVSGYVWLKLAAACTTVVTAKTMMRWFAQ